MGDLQFTASPIEEHGLLPERRYHTQQSTSKFQGTIGDQRAFRRCRGRVAIGLCRNLEVHLRKLLT